MSTSCKEVLSDDEVVMLNNELTACEREARASIMQQLGNVTNVKGDGSCFIYAVLIAVGHLDHKKGEQPSKQDLFKQSLLRARIAEWWQRYPSVAEDGGTPVQQIIYRMTQGPQYEKNCLIQMGSYDGLSAFMALANTLNIDIIVWNAAAPAVTHSHSHLRNADWRHRLGCHTRMVL